MVVYRVTPQWLLVADPNYPGIGRRIRFDPATGKLGPFVSGNNAADIAAGMTVTYTRFAYLPWESSTSTDALAARWTQFEGGTAGGAVFPGYDLLVSSGKDAAGKDVLVPWTDGYATTEPTIDVQVSALHDGRHRSCTPTPAHPHPHHGSAALQGDPQARSGRERVWRGVLGQEGRCLGVRRFRPPGGERPGPNPDPKSPRPP